MLLFGMILMLTSSQISTFIPHIKAEGKSNDTDLSIDSEDIFEEASSILKEKYSTYIDDVNSDQYSGNDVVLDDISKLVSDESFIGTYEGKDVIKIDQNEETTITINAPETALYYV